MIKKTGGVLALSHVDDYERGEEDLTFSFISNIAFLLMIDQSWAECLQIHQMSCSFKYEKSS